MQAIFNDLSSLVEFEPRIFIHAVKTKRRRSETSIVGIPEQFDLNKIASAMRKKMNCICSVGVTEHGKPRIKLSGDQRQSCVEFLLEEQICKKHDIKVRGF